MSENRTPKEPSGSPNKVPPNSYADDPKKGGYPATMKPDPKIKAK